MEITTIFLLAVSLAMDAFAVSVTSGLTMGKFRLESALRISLFFGGFQAVMPIIGFFAGLNIRAYIAEFDHWVAFGLLSLVGAKMIYEAVFNHENTEKMNPEHLPTLLVLSVATSIDALAVGFSLSLLQEGIIAAAAVIGIVTFVISFIGVAMGKYTGRLFGNKIEVLGGVILIGIGIKILFEHLL